MVRIVIELDPATGQVSVNGPTDKILSVGLLEVAKAAMLAQKGEPRQIVPVGSLPAGMRSQ